MDACHPHPPTQTHLLLRMVDRRGRGVLPPTIKALACPVNTTATSRSATMVSCMTGLLLLLLLLMLVVVDVVVGG
jgi:hypothetical protein